MFGKGFDLFFRMVRQLIFTSSETLHAYAQEFSTGLKEIIPKSAPRSLLLKSVASPEES